jgi:lipopolysaccharide/colanic/teichoic acid biosynthesis glycosyltransferase
MRNAKQTAAAAAARRTRTRHPATTAPARAARRAADRLTASLASLTTKRTLDVLLGSALLLLATPALAAAAAALAVRRPRGDVLCRETRTGLGGRLFELRSLRTRRWRLDLLSRLPHVVRGELSLVGPAPLTPDEAALLGAAAARWRHTVRPGLTGLAQVRARSGMPWDEPALLDAHYTEHHGTGLDLAILAQSAHIPLRAALSGLRVPGKARLSDTDHRLPGYSVAE